MANYLITIPDACSQDWNQMTPKENGRHCISCNKVVKDFTGMSEKQILEILLTNKSVCGRIQSKKLNKPIQRFKPVRYTKYHWPSVAAFVVAGMFSVASGFSQTPNTQKLYDRSLATPKYLEDKSSSTKADPGNAADKVLSQIESHFTLNGTVVTKDKYHSFFSDSLAENENGLFNVPNATIKVYRGERLIEEIKTDELGKFQLDIDNSYLNKWLDFKVEAPDMEDKVFYHKFGKQENPDTTLIFELERVHHFMGVVTVVRREPIIVPGTIGSRIDIDQFIDFYFGR